MAAFVSVLLGLCLTSSRGSPPDEAEIEVMFERFQKDYNRTYSSNSARFPAFKANVNRAYAMNLEQGIECTDLFDDERCVFGITKFSDFFEDEFKKTHLGYRRAPERPIADILSLEDLPEAPEAVDWRAKGAVTPVKNQGSCGSCWAFSTTEEVESAVFMSTGKLLTLSTQQIISCDRKSDDGCNGGDTTTAYKYLEGVGGLDTASDYPDRSHISGRTGRCKWDKKKAAKVIGWKYATKPCPGGLCKNQSEATLARALAAKGPISICVNANDWSPYKGGIYKAPCSGAEGSLDHCVQLVGYDKSGPTPYWIVRNSWAADWGINGYMHLAMGENLCGVADEATLVHATTEEMTDSQTVV